MWLIGLGCVVGLVALLVVWGVLAIAYRPAARAVPLALREGVLAPILAVMMLLALAGIAGCFIIERPSEYVRSLTRYPQVGSREYTEQIAAPPGPLAEMEHQDVPVEIRGDEVVQIRVNCDESLIVATPPDSEGNSAVVFQTDGGTEYVWSKGEGGRARLAGLQFDRLHVTNLGDQETQLELTVLSEVMHPEVRIIPFTALSVIAVVLLYLLQTVAIPKVSAVSLATAKSQMVQPIYVLLMIMGCTLLFLFIFIPYHTFGEDIKVLKDSGLTLIMVFGILQAIWAASNEISEELEGRTALTVLSKPIGRREFLLGKFLGIIWSVAVMFIVLGVMLLFVVSYKVIFDAREAAYPEPPWQECYVEVARTIPGLVLAFMETLVLASISVALSTRLPVLANALICFSIYVAGHLTPLIVQSSLGQFEPVRFVGKLIATIFPVLEYFSVQAAVAGGRDIPLEYLGAALLFCVLYCSMAMLLALALFEDRDLA